MRADVYRVSKSVHRPQQPVCMIHSSRELLVPCLTVWNHVTFYRGLRHRTFRPLDLGPLNAPKVHATRMEICDKRYRTSKLVVCHDGASGAVSPVSPPLRTERSEHHHRAERSELPPPRTERSEQPQYRAVGAPPVRQGGQSGRSFPHPRRQGGLSFPHPLGQSGRSSHPRGQSGRSFSHPRRQSGRRFPHPRRQSGRSSPSRTERSVIPLPLGQSGRRSTYADEVGLYRHSTVGRRRPAVFTPPQRHFSPCRPDIYSVARRQPA